MKAIRHTSNCQQGGVSEERGKLKGVGLAYPQKICPTKSISMFFANTLRAMKPTRAVNCEEGSALGWICVVKVKQQDLRR